MSWAEVMHVLVVQQVLASSCGWLRFIASRTASTIAVGIVIPDLAVSVWIARRGEGTEVRLRLGVGTTGEGVAEVDRQGGDGEQQRRTSSP